MDTNKISKVLIKSSSIVEDDKLEIIESKSETNDTPNIIIKPKAKKLKKDKIIIES